MVWWRRERLHERLAREGGVALERDPREAGRPPWDKAGIHGVPPPRRWDVVVTVAAPDLAGDEATFVALPDGRLLAGAGHEVAALAPLAAALEDAVDPPYRAEAVRRTPEVWAAAARKIEVVGLPPGTPGDVLTVSVSSGERTTVVDGEEWLAALPALEDVGRARGLDDFVVEAVRLEGEAWEVRISAL